MQCTDVRRSLLAILLTVACYSPGFAAAPVKPLTVFAAASLTDALTEISNAYTQASHIPVRLSFASSSALARQLEGGARADVFFSADVEWVDYLQARKLIDASTRRDVLGNRLVLIAPTGNKVELRIAPNFPIAKTLGKRRLATGDPDSVPVGRYARSALISLGVWSDVADRIVPTDNVRVALAYVARGEAALGIVYKTDALIEKKVRIVDTFPMDSHSPIVYPLALTRNAAPAAHDYAAFVASKDAAAIFAKYGFDSLTNKRVSAR
jgi:molybdate transport system substrate-binding protein